MNIQIILFASYIKLISDYSKRKNWNSAMLILQGYTFTVEREIEREFCKERVDWIKDRKEKRYRDKRGKQNFKYMN